MSLAHSPVFVPRNSDTWRDPFPLYAALRASGAVHRADPLDGEELEYYVLPRHENVWNAVRDPETFSSAQGLTLHYGDLEKIGLQDDPPMVMQDPPVHTEFRRLVARGFTPRQVEAVEPAVRAFVVERIERLREQGGGDIVAELFKPLPSMVVAHYLGVPAEDRDRFDGWTDSIVAANSGGGDISSVVAGAAQAVGELMGYFGELIERRRTEPEDDVVSHLVAAGIGADGDVAGVVPILGFTFTMVAGGNDTTTGMLGGAIQLLEHHPEQQRMIRDDPPFIPDAVEEFLRLTSPVQGLARTTTREVHLDGATIPADRRVLLLYGSANRDERVFGPDAEQLDITRRPRHILTFAQGPHHCLGAAAARMQSRVALEELVARTTHLEVDLDGVRWAPGAYVRRPTTVPVSLR
ncbi:cytochrome P450 [Tsukamurella sp. PLM1]|uniref:cytochrome P450 n=1 Tax=Tsukamurella sp. PLM1 TaxID=2929795 RepID=UPI0020508779|nr:cytochrome P450 [Tsukamurella sp. PLM1]BDH59340.1 putative cytochrome P450 [Tsukamurella sp. PLM1]